MNKILYPKSQKSKIINFQSTKEKDSQFGEFNQLSLEIDELKTNALMQTQKASALAEGQGENASDISTLQTTVGTHTSQISQFNNSISALQNTVATHTSQISALSSNKQNNLTDGNGIDISNNTISADTTVLATKTDLASKQDTLTAGNNISISGGTISATDTTYTAGTGISISGQNVISSSALTEVQATDINSQNATSGQVLTADGQGGASWQNSSASITLDNSPTRYSNNAVKSGGVFDALALKQDVILFDTVPRENSTSPITSGGVYNALQNISGGLSTVSASDVDSGNATSGQVLTADGQGGASWQTPSGGGMTQEQQTMLTNAYNYYLTHVVEPDPAYNPQTYSDYPAGTIFQTYDAYERDYYTTSTTSAITLPTAYFVAEAGCSADICYSVDVECTSSSLGLDLIFSLYVNGSRVCYEQTSIANDQTLHFSKTEYGIVLNQSAKNNNVYIKIERSGSGTLAVNHEKIEIIAPNANFFNKIRPITVDYIGGVYYIADCSDGNAKLATINATDMFNMSNLQFVDLGIEAQHLVVGKNVQTVGTISNYDKTLYVYETKTNQVKFYDLSAETTITWTNPYYNLDWEFNSSQQFYLVGTRAPDVARFIMYNPTNQLVSVGIENNKFSNIIATSPLKKHHVDPSGEASTKCIVQITDCGQAYLSYGSSTLDNRNLNLGYATYARAYLKNYVSSRQFGIDVYLKRFDKIVKYDVEYTNSSGFVVNSTTTIGSYDDFILGGNDDYFVIKNHVLEYHKFPS